MTAMEKQKRKVVVTGMGCVTPLGIGKDAFWRSLVAGVSGAGPNDLFDCTDIASRVVARVRDFEPSDYMERKDIKRTDRYVHFAIAAAKMAVEDARLTISPDEAERAGVFIGSGVGGMSTMIEGCRTIHERGMGRVSVFTIQMLLPNMAAGHVALLVGAKGPSEACVTACASSTNAIGDAFRCIARGEIDIAVSGGAEAALNPIAVASFSNMRGITRRNDEPERASRPFDRDRDGFVPSEGSGVVVLECEEHALARGARIYGEIVGYGMSNDAFDMVHPAPGGMGAASAMRNAIRDAGLEPADIEYINPHATSTPAGDAAENAAIKSVFGAHAYDMAISATKSMTGHMIGAAGAVEAMATLIAMNESRLPPTINLDSPDDDCDLNYVAHKAIDRKVDIAMSNSLGFGGHNASIVLRGRRKEQIH
jgi:3-oxoacyl-[acyl-carrier-protein] synthase II